MAIARELAELTGESPRLFVVTRNAATVAPGDVANLEQAGVPGLMRVIDSEHPHLSATQIDVDAATEPGHLALQLKSGSEEDETAWRDGRWYTARLRPGPLRPAERRTTVVQHGRDGMRLQIRTPGDLESLEFAAFDRIPPGPGEIEVAVRTSTHNFADVLVAFGRYPTFEGFQQRLGGGFAGVVTAVDPDVTDHRVGDRVGGMSRALPREEWPAAIRRLVSGQISLLLRRTIDPDRPLSDYGLDSLGNLELRTRIETETGVRTSPTKIATVRGLAEHLCDELADLEAAPSAS